MQKQSIGRTVMIVIVLLAFSSFSYLQASLLDTPSPYWSQNQPLGRNPARAAYLKKQNRLNAGYTLGTQLNYTDNYYKSIDAWSDYYKETSAEAPNPYTNSYFSSAIPLGSDKLYLSLLYNNYQNSKRTNWVPSKNVSAPDIVSMQHFEDSNLSNISGGFSLSMPLLNNSIFLGFESLYNKNIYESYIQKNEYTSIGGLINRGSTNNLYCYDSDPYYSYSLAVIIPFQSVLTLELSHTISTPRFTVASYRLRDNLNPALNTDDDNIDQYYDYLPSMTGIGFTFIGLKNFELGLSSEFFTNGTFYDRHENEQNYISTKQFTRYSLAIEYSPVPAFTFRTFGSITPQKDARTNYYDWALLEDKRTYTPANDDNVASENYWGDYDSQNIFNEEEFGIDLEFTAAEKYSAILGVSKKNYIFAGNRPPYGIALAVEDIRTYFGISIIGVFEGNDQPQKKTKAIPTKFDKIPTADTKRADRDTENTITPKEGTPNAYTTFQEEVYISAQNVFPGDNLIVTLKEGKNPLFKATVGYAIKKQEYRYSLYQDDANKTWTATVPVSPLTPPGTYTVKLNKIYDDTSLEVSTFTVTVKALPKDQQ